MAKTQSIIVKDTTVRSYTQNGMDYICITDIARQKNAEDPNGVVGNWMRNRNTLEYLGLWEMLNNPDFNPLEFEGFRNGYGLPVREKESSLLAALIWFLPTCQVVRDDVEQEIGAGTEVCAGEGGSVEHVKPPAHPVAETLV